MDLITPTTELQAVNAILRSIGESPLETLSGTLPVDGEMARDTLRAEMIAVQTHGWSFNEETDVTLAPDASGIVYLPANTLRFLYSDPTIVQRGGRLYDRVNHTDRFTASITATLIVGLPFDDLPEALRRYLTLHSGRKFQDDMGGDRVMHEFQVKDELAAWTAFLNFEAEVAQHNVLDAAKQTLVSKLKGRRP